MSNTQFVVVWFADGNIYSLQDSRGEPVYLSDAEVNEDLDGYIRSQGEADNAFAASDPDQRFGITPDALEIFYGIYL